MDEKFDFLSVNLFKVIARARFGGRNAIVSQFGDELGNKNFRLLQPAHTITPTAFAPRSARRFRARRSMQAMRTATPISTCS